MYGASPSLVQSVTMDFIEEHDCILFKMRDAESGTELAISISVPKIFRKCEHLGISSEEFDDDLYSIKSRHLLITKILC